MVDGITDLLIPPTCYCDYSRTGVGTELIVLSSRGRLSWRIEITELLCLLLLLQLSDPRYKCTRILTCASWLVIYIAIYINGHNSSYHTFSVRNEFVCRVAVTGFQTFFGFTTL